MVSRDVGSNGLPVQSAKINPWVVEQEFPQLFDLELVSKAPGLALNRVGSY